MKTIILHDGQRIHVVGNHDALALHNSLLEEMYKDFNLDTNKLNYKTAKNLIKKNHKDMWEWLIQNNCLCTFWLNHGFLKKIQVDDEANPLGIEYGLGFHPTQEKLETLFLLRWS